jgi:hypothetical protein
MNQREKLIERFLRKSDYKIEKEDYDFLSTLDEFKTILDSQNEFDIYYGDVGNDYSTLWGLYKIDSEYNNRLLLSDKVESYKIKSKILEIHPYTDQEISNIEKEKKSKKITFGKYKGKSIDWIRQNDDKYIDWCLDNIKGFENKYLLAK